MFENSFISPAWRVSGASNDPQILLKNHFSKHDMNWISYFFAEEGQGFSADWQDQYWRGVPYPGKEPIWETLIEGKMWVVNKELRQLCYDRLLTSGSTLLSDSLLRLSCIAASYGYSFGEIAFCYIKHESCELIVPLINHKEEERIKTIKEAKLLDPNLLATVKIRDENTLWYVPDLRELTYCITHKSYNCINCQSAFVSKGSEG